MGMSIRFCSRMMSNCGVFDFVPGRLNRGIHCTY